MQVELGRIQVHKNRKRILENASLLLHQAVPLGMKLKHVSQLMLDQSCLLLIRNQKELFPSIGSLDLPDYLVRPCSTLRIELDRIRWDSNDYRIRSNQMIIKFRSTDSLCPTGLIAYLSWLTTLSGHYTLSLV